MAQLVVKPGMSALVGPHGDAFGAAARHAQQWARRVLTELVAAVGRIGRWAHESDGELRWLEPGYFETARMAREMYRL